MGDGVPVGSGRAFIDLHCHTRASFDSLSDPVKVAAAAAARGLSHLVVTDHDRIDGALEARASPPDDLAVIVGEEIRVREGDLIAAFLTEAIEPGLSALEAIDEVRRQGGLVGVPHPFDRFRGFGSGREDLEAIADQVDWIEAYNARVLSGDANAEAAHLARERGLPGVAVSDAHAVLEVGVAYVAVRGDPSTPAGLLASLADLELVTGRATYLVRGWTPLAKMVQWLRGNGRARAGAR